MSRKTFFTSAIIVLVGGIVATLIFQRANRVPYELATVQQGNIVQEVSASGKVESPARVNLQFKNSGEITFLKTEVDQKVKKGEVLAKQDASLLYAQLKQAQATLKNQEYKLRSREENNIKNYDDKYDIKAQKALVEQAQADIELQKVKISETVLVSPMDGVIVTADSEVGEIVKPETLVVSIISDESLQINVDVAETAIANVKVGQTVRITLDAFDNAIEWAGIVTEIDPAETIRGGAVYYKTIVSFDKKDSNIKSGMSANIWIETAISENTLLIPVSALQNNNKNIVRVLQGKQVVEKEVVTGLRNDSGMVEIISGLSQGKQIVIGNKK
ncbi:MAG: efflux RND transporter periplasmic adaptor subunit [Candidatus Moraniibacteriota bacterium]